MYLGPNNIGKTTILEALNLLLNPEIGNRSSSVVDENDFYRREYLPVDAQALSVPGGAPPTAQDAPVAAVVPETEATSNEATTELDSEQQEFPTIRIEAVIADLSTEDIGDFPGVVPWDAAKRVVVEEGEEGDDPFARAERALRVCFEAWYDPDEDDFASASFFRNDPQVGRDGSPTFTRFHKRKIGFLIYRDFRALQRPVTLEPIALFWRLLGSQDATPKHFEDVLNKMSGAIAPLFAEANFARVVNEYKQELERYLPIGSAGGGTLSFEPTDRTRNQVKAAAQLYVKDGLPLPLQKMGAGTRSLAILAMLLLIARKRGRGIMALEEPETFLFPHAQRRVIDEVQQLASQVFVTTHSPYVLERLPIECFQRVCRDDQAAISAMPVVADAKDAKNIRARFRQQMSEALLGRAAIIVEEESTRIWILRASALLHGVDFEGQKGEALELYGVSVVAAQGNMDVPTAAQLLKRAGIRVVGFLDRFAKDADVDAFQAKMADLAVWWHAEEGLEDLLLKELAPASLREALVAAPYVKQNYDATTVASWNDEELRSKAREFLRHNKGSLPFHEWLAEHAANTQFPLTFKRLVVEGARLAATEDVYSCSLLWQ